MNNSDIEYFDLLLNGVGIRITEILQSEKNEYLINALIHTKSHLNEARRDIRAAAEFLPAENING